MMLRTLCLLALLLCQLPALAHKASDSYLMVNVQGATVRTQWDIALRDVDFALGLDENGNGEITWGELRVRKAELGAWAVSRLDLQRGGACTSQLDTLQVDDHTDGGYAVLGIQSTCPADAGPFSLGYRLLFDLDAQHRGLLRLTLDGAEHSAVMAPENRQMQWQSGTSSGLEQLRQYMVEGVWHIWIGFDHILFLLGLLLPAVLVREGGRWRGVTHLKLAFKEVAWVVTAFTVAHSVTLSLAALGWVSLPSRLVESVIALSVLLAAANNLMPVVVHKRWLAAFVFGLIHGFGFASVLAELGLPADTLVLSLVGFNVGVELGQLAIVAVFLPLAFVLRHTPFYSRGIFVGGSVLIMLISAVWLAERVFDLNLLA